MRYMGDPLDLEVVSSLDAATKQRLLEAARSMPDDRASDLQDVVDETRYGAKTKWIRIGLGAAAGLAVGYLVGRRKR